VNVTGEYVWTGLDNAPETRDGFRLLRTSSNPARLAA
jgi:hypothetical protein